MRNRQLISIIILLAVTAFINTIPASHMLSEGNWGDPLGLLFFGPLVVFYGVHTLLYYAVYLIGRPSSVATYTTSKLNYVALAVGIAGILGEAAQRNAPPM